MNGAGEGFFHAGIGTFNNEELWEDLRKTALKSTRTGGHSAVRGSASSTLSTNAEEKRRIDRMKYTWELWKRVPYNGISKDMQLHKALEQVQDQVNAKLNAQQDAILQRMKTREALKKWRDETRVMQMTKKSKSPVKPSCESAPFGNDFNEEKPVARKTLRPSEYAKELEECWDKLRQFQQNPAPLGDSELAFARLKEVQDIHKKLSELRVSRHAE